MFPVGQFTHLLPQDRREQNRQAQQAFRQRRKAAEVAQQRRIKQLEDSVEEMGRMIVGLCDEMMAATAEGDLVQRPGLMNLLRSSIARSLELAKSVDDAADDDAPPEERVETRKQDEPIQIPIPIPMPMPMQMPSPPWPAPEPTTPFAARLVETTLSQACLYLNGGAYISETHYKRAFGYSLRSHTHTQLLARLQWLLGPGRARLYASSSTFRVSPAEGLVTAADVQEQLSGLGARDLDPDTMELRIGGGGGEQEGMVVMLRTSTLTASLAHAAVCLDRGPGYPRDEVHKAVEASVVQARGM